MTLAASRAMTVRDSGGRAWTPASLSSDALVARWVAASVAQSDGTTVSSWADQVAGNTLTPANGTVVYHTGAVSNAINGQPVVSFAGSASLKTTTPKNIPAGTPFTVIAVCRVTGGLAATQVVFEYGGAGSKGYMIGTDNSNPNKYLANAYTVGSVTAGQVTPAAGAAPAAIVGRFTKTAVSCYTNFLANPPATALASDIAGPVTQVTIGQTLAGTNGFTGDLAEVIVCRDLLSLADMRKISRYVWTTYGIKTGSLLNAAAAAAWGTTNYDSSGKAIEVDAVYDPALSFGHPFWFGYVPNATNEDPSIVYSDQPDSGYTRPAAVANPIVAHRSTGTNADPHLRWQADGNWYVYYQVENDGANNGTFAQSTSDPRTGPWSAAVSIMGTNSLPQQNGEAVAVWDGTGYVLFGAWVANTLTKSARSSSPIGPFTGFTNCTLPIPGSRSLGAEGEFDVRLNPAGTHFILCVSDNDSVHNLWFATSPVSDGLTWTVKSYPVMVPSFGWDSGTLYRPSFAPDPANGVCRLWYSNSNGTQLGYTTIPLSEIEP